ncbi:MAG: DeoR/GlpR family DNA-binding transcription regulator [Oscillospiraceae bacterium]
MQGDKSGRNSQKLLDEMEFKSAITTEEAVQILNVSEATARRLFNSMAKAGIVVRTFGGICKIQAAVGEYSYETVAAQNGSAKYDIAQMACSLCESNDVLYLDGGSTLSVFAKELSMRIKSGNLENISVYTNSLTTLTALSDCCAVSLLGGRWRSNRRDFCGYLAEDAVRKLSFKACFLGTDACETRGLTTTDFETARLNELVTAASFRRYALVDAGKFSKNSFVPFAPLSQMTGIITDASLAYETKVEFENSGANIFVQEK